MATVIFLCERMAKIRNPFYGSEGNLISISSRLKKQKVFCASGRGAHTVV